MIYPLVVLGLKARFGDVSRQMVTIYDWNSPAGQQFLDYVGAAVAGGADINEIGALIGVRNFSNRYRILRGSTP